MTSNTNDKYVDLLKSARNGNMNALGKLLETERSELLRLTAKFSGRLFMSRASHRDFVQDAIARGLEKFETFHGQTQLEFRSWLLGILTNVLISQYRHHYLSQKRSLHLEKQIGEELADESLRLGWTFSDSTPSRKAIENEQDRSLHDAIECLHPDIRETIVLRDFQNLSFLEIAKIQQCSPKAAQKRYARGIIQLGQRLRKVQ